MIIVLVNYYHCHLILCLWSRSNMNLREDKQLNNWQGDKHNVRLLLLYDRTKRDFSQSVHQALSIKSSDINTLSISECEISEFEPESKTQGHRKDPILAMHHAYLKSTLNINNACIRFVMCAVCLCVTNLNLKKKKLYMQYAGSMCINMPCGLYFMLAHSLRQFVQFKRKYHAIAEQMNK